MELTPIQKDIIIALINLQRQKNRAIKGEEIADLINRNPGTVRNQMQSLKVLGLVEGVPGPKGGYKITSAAYEALNVTSVENEVIVPIYRNGILIQGSTAAEISFTTVRHPELCNGMIKVLGNIRDFVEGDIVQIGPTPVNRLIVRGEVVGRDDTKNALLFSITEMVSLPKRPVKNYIKEDPVFVNVNATIQEAARIFVKNNIHGAPVEDKGKVVGVVTFTDIGNALASGKISLKVRDIMTKDLITIDGDTPLYQSVKMFNEHNVGRLIVTIDGVPKGILSKADVLHELAVY
ncbi:putative signal transduction protein with CBS domains [Methanosalsum zhilinae DSM 4017]|uniref:Putative signal transduction protein with CBS domains n=1 Tax=Methanosalsum zhilinae (strain DSM 4017 / NBRC 107636 / OCM 62 / WeN5) TaxID=679901 RepID=F7XKH8_METZD|nr:CBS domain-containing protein [Methanosalsum zhilinae]AEH61752.1 putative signal transduction protein with CBS domains [Methanosalsum zhilinae DSM 4017]